MRNRLSGVFVGLSCLIVACAADAAGDGIKRIKQPSTFPYVITTPGSYMLVANITVPNANTTAIKIQADNVKINLNGFTIKGATTCNPSTYTCSNTGSGIGIDADSRVGITVVDGTVEGMGSNGIFMEGGRVERVRVANNGGSGVVIDGGFEGGRVDSVIATHNGASGLYLATGVVSNCLVTNNGHNGIDAGDAGVFVQNHVEGNQNHGVIGGGGGATVLAQNAASVNGGVGLYAYDGATVVGNAAVGNNSGGIVAANSAISLNTAFGNQGTGVYATGATVANTIHGNDTGLDESNGGGYSLNSITGNPTSEVTGGTEVGANLCGGDLTCP